MSAITEDILSEISFELHKKASVELGKDVLSMLRNAYKRESNELARVNLKTMIETARIAKEEGRAICQDTGLPIFFVTIGEFAGVRGNIQNAIDKGVLRATKEVPLRENVVNPITNENPGTNVGWGIPYIHYDYKPDIDYIDLMAIPMGGGSALATQIVGLPTIGPRLETIKKSVLDAVIAARSRCPPFVIGLCVGGYFDIAVKEAVKAIYRFPLGSWNPDPEIAKIECDLLKAINELKVGPMGLGGDTTALALHMEVRGSHTARPAVAIAFNCWVLRRARVRIYANGTVEHFTFHEGDG
jgi:fumarate hydratase subunit alpha